MEINDKITAVIVLYNPDEQQITSVVNILNINNIDVILVDNSDSPAKFEFLECDYYYLNGNLGIARAQNIGCKVAIKSGADYVWFFDQDSNITSEFVNNFLSGINSDDLIYAPMFLDEKTGFEFEIIDINKNGKRKKILPSLQPCNFYASTVISSGTFVNTIVFEKIGFMCEELFIDYVDTEWCLRCLHSDLKIKILINATMQHSIGDKTLKLFGFNVPVHSPLRRYYRIRNSLHLFRFPHVPTILACREVFFAIIHQIILLLTQRKKLEYLKFGIFGFWDGLLNKVGAFKDTK